MRSSGWGPEVAALLRALLTVTVLAAVTGCHATRPSTLREPVGDQPAVLVKRLRIPDGEPWYTRFASHSWFDVRATPGGVWRRVEIPTPNSGVQDLPIGPEAPFEDERWGRAVEVLTAVAGPDAASMANGVLLRARDYDDSVYRAWPGPNSNTFVERVLRDVDGLTSQLDHNAVGKDWAFPGRIGASASGYGVELELPLLGVQLGLLEGVELHILGLTLGVGIWPLSLKLPLLPALELVEPPPTSFGWSPRDSP